MRLAGHEACETMRGADNGYGGSVIAPDAIFHSNLLVVYLTTLLVAEIIAWYFW
jgi:hypothetical protein